MERDIAIYGADIDRQTKHALEYEAPMQEHRVVEMDEMCRDACNRTMEPTGLAYVLLGSSARISDFVPILRRSL